MSHAKAYEDPGTPEEQSRRSFMANATLAVGGVIGLVLTVPILGYVVPSKDVMASKAKWWPLNEADFKKLSTSTDPIKISFTRKVQDAYTPPVETDDYVWGVKMNDAEFAKMKAERKDLFSGGGKIDYPFWQMGLVIFSSVCPHLGCKFDWKKELNKFFCPCHNSEFLKDGEHVAGPAARGLDPLPMREQNGKAEITWIQYKAATADRIIITYG